MGVGVELERRTLRLREPVRTAFGEVRERELLLLSLEGADGVRGWGESAPLEPYDGVPLEAAAGALEAYAPVLARADDLSGAEVLDRCRALADLPEALAAVDMALWDRAGRRAARPLSALLSEAAAWQVPVNAFVGAVDRAGAAAAAAVARGEGFACVKVKVGVGDDAGRVAAVRAAAGPEVALRLDANGAWTVEEAIATIGALAPAGLELVEEPVHGTHALAQVRRAVPVRVAMDETAAEPGALASGAADAVCLKIGRCGGVGGLLAAAALVRSTGAEPYVASALDGPLGVAAALHCAAALRPEPACGLATLGLFADGSLAGLLPVSGGAMAVPDAPGLGVEWP